MFSVLRCCLFFMPCLGFLLRMSLSTGQVGIHRNKRTLGTFWSQIITRGALRFVYFCLSGPQFSFSYKGERLWTRWLRAISLPMFLPLYFSDSQTPFHVHYHHPIPFPPVNSSYPYNMSQSFYFLN